MVNLVAVLELSAVSHGCHQNMKLSSFLFKLHFSENFKHLKSKLLEFGVMYLSAS